MVDILPPLQPEWTFDDPAPISHRQIRRKHHEVIDLTDDEDDDSSVPTRDPIRTVQIKDEVEEIHPDGTVTGAEQAPPTPPPAPTPLEPPTAPSTTEGSSLRRSSRAHRPNKRFVNDDFVGSFLTHGEAAFQGKRKVTKQSLDDSYLQQLDWNQSLSMLAHDSDYSEDSRRFFAHFDSMQDPDTDVLDSFPTLALASRAAAEDNPRWMEATQGANADGFWKSMVVEIN